MELNKATELYNHFYDTVNGHSISIQGRDNHGYESKSFVYGEIMPESFHEFLSTIAPHPDQVFYDFGSGTGKAVMLAHLLFNFSKSVGIEFVDTLHEASLAVLGEYHAMQAAAPSENQGKISFILGSFLDVDVSDADIIFMNSTCFQEELMDALDEKLKTLKPGSHILTLSKSLKSADYSLDRHKKYQFSWGEATVFFHTKL